MFDGDRCRVGGMSQPEQDPQQQERMRLRAQYQEALELVWKKPDNCPICDSTAWNLGDLIDAPLRQVSSLGWWEMDPHEEKRAYVYAPVTCLYCGYTIFFHKGVLDVRTTEEVKAVPPLRSPGEQR
jgi:hypothetical protein